MHFVLNTFCDRAIRGEYNVNHNVSYKSPVGLCRVPFTHITQTRAMIITAEVASDAVIIINEILNFAASATGTYT